MKKQSENDIKKAIREYLEYNGWEVYRINNCGVWNEKRKQFIFHGTPGMCDLVALKDGHSMLCIETKAPGRKASESQHYFLERANNAKGVFGFCVDSFDSFLSHFNKIERV